MGKSPDEIKQVIIEVAKTGRFHIKQLSEKTGLSAATVGKYSGILAAEKKVRLEKDGTNLKVIVLEEGSGRNE